MRKRVLSFILAGAMVFSQAVPGFAESVSSVNADPAQEVVTQDAGSDAKVDSSEDVTEAQAKESVKEENKAVTEAKKDTKADNNADTNEAVTEAQKDTETATEAKANTKDVSRANKQAQAKSSDSQNAAVKDDPIPAYTVTYIVGSSQYPLQAIAAGEGYVVPAFTGNTAKADDGTYHYTFSGWKSSQDSKIYTAAQLQNMPVTADVTFTAQYNQQRLMSTVTIGKIADQTYTGYGIQPAISLAAAGSYLRLNVDYRVAYVNNVNKGTATISISGINGYYGTRQTTFKIVTKSIKGAGVSSKKLAKQTFTGKKLKPDVKLYYKGKRLIKNVDYKLTYKNNKVKGTATITVKGKGNFTGKRKVTFKIVPAKFSSATVKVSEIGEYIYTGSAIKPTPTVKYKGKKLRKNVDYTLSYSNNVSKGKATITIKGKNEYKGSVKKTFVINKAAIGDATAYDIAKQTYTGSSIRPDVKLIYKGKRLKLGTDYTLSYRNNVSVGTATVYVTGKGNFRGDFRMTFTIAKKQQTTPAKETYQNYKVTADSVFYRSGAGMTYPTVGSLKKDTVVKVVVGGNKVVTGTTWYRIYLSGNYYYISAAYLTKA